MVAMLGRNITIIIIVIIIIIVFVLVIIVVDLDKSVDDFMSSLSNVKCKEINVSIYAEIV